MSALKDNERADVETRATHREPVFNQTLELGIVVRDLDATMRRYTDDCWISPSPDKARRGKVGDRPVVRRRRLSLKPIFRIGPDDTGSLPSVLVTAASLDRA
jgi:hypothetical protein